MMYGARSPRSRAACDVVELALAEHGGADGAGDDGREDEPDHDDQRRVRAADGDECEDRDHDQRQREDRVDRAG